MRVTRIGSSKGMIFRKAIMVVFGMLAALSSLAVNGYKITLKTNLKDHKVYIWYNYGENKYPLDTSMTNNEGTAVFEKPDVLTGGVFILYLTPKKALEFLLTEENIFTINIDTTDISGKTTFIGSRENIVYYDFLRRINANFYQEEILRQRKSRVNDADSVAILKKMIDAYQKQEELIKKQVVEKNKGTFIADLIAAGTMPEVNANQSAQLIWKEKKRRFFEHVNFANEKLAFSPILFDLCKTYLENYTDHQGDSLIAACHLILKKAEAGKENFKWSLYYLSSYFERTVIPGQDKAFVYLVEEYYKKGKCWWLTKAQLDNMIRRAEILKRLFVGSLCPDFTAQDSSGKEVTLHSKIKKLTVLYFWSYDCKHCLEETPKLVEWMKKHPKIDLLTACATPDEEKWKEKLNEFHIPGFHFIDPDLKANYNYTYSITATPQIFVIDKNKKILGKYIDDTKALDEFIRANKL